MTAELHPPFLVVGHLNKAHGMKGELFIWPLTDYPGSHFAPGVVLLPGNADGTRPSESLAPLTIETVRPYRKGYLAKFVGVDGRTAAEGFRDVYLLRPFDSIDELDTGEIFYHELIGSTVVTPDDVVIGTVQEVYPIKPADLLEVAGPEGNVMIPLIPQVVVRFEREQRRIVVDPPDGLLAP